ncbi:MAG: cation-transporting P-type ATPase, partial [Pseudomonas helleri]
MSDITLAGDGSTSSDPVKKASSPSSSSSSNAKPARLDAEGIKKEISQLNSSPDGLSSATAKSLLEKYGPNAIEAKEDSRWKKLLGYFWGPIPWMIEIAALISLARQDWPDFIVITGLLLYNAAVGFWQDNKAASALAALKKGRRQKLSATPDLSGTVLP